MKLNCVFFGSFISLQNNLEFSRELNSFFARACAKILSFGSFQFEMMLLSKTPLHSVWNSLKMSHFTTLITFYFQSKSIWRIHNMSRFFFVTETILVIFKPSSLQLSSTFQRMSECESIKVWKLEHQQQKHFCVWENSTSVTVQLIPLVISLGTIDTVVAFLLLGKFNSTFTSLQKVLHTRKRS